MISRPFVEESRQNPGRGVVFDSSRRAVFAGPLTECEAWVRGYGVAEAEFGRMREAYAEYLSVWNRP